jgi:hypothetical protein
MRRGGCGRANRLRGLPAAVACHLDKVRARNPCFVGIMEYDAAVSKERAKALQSRGIEIWEGLHELGFALRDITKLSAEVTGLASLRAFRVANGILKSDEGVQVGERSCAVAILRDGINVKMIHYHQLLAGSLGKNLEKWRRTEWTTLLGEVGPIELEDDALSIRVGNGSQRALDVAAIGVGCLEEGSIGKSGLVDDALRIVRRNGGIAEFSCGRARRRDGRRWGSKRDRSLGGNLCARSREGQRQDS